MYQRTGNLINRILLLVACNMSFWSSRSLLIPDFLSSCTFHIRTDFSRGDASSRVGLLQAVSTIPKRNSIHTPLILEQINRTIVNMYKNTSVGMGVLLSTYNNGLNYRRVPSKHTICTVAQIFSYWLQQDGMHERDASLQNFIAIKQVVDSEAYPHFILFEDSNLWRQSNAGNEFKFPIIPHISTTAVFAVFNSDNSECYLVKWVNGNLGSGKALLGPEVSSLSCIVELLRIWEKS